MRKERKPEICTKISNKSWIYHKKSIYTIKYIDTYQLMVYNGIRANKQEEVKECIQRISRFTIL